MNMLFRRGAWLLMLALLAGCGTPAPTAAPAATTKPAAAAAGPGSGPPKTVAEIAQYQGTDRQQVLEQLSKAESGPVVVYSAGTNMQPVLDAFVKKYPWVQSQIVTGDSVEMSRRLVEEYRAGRSEMDIMEQGLEGLLLPLEQGVFQPFYTPEWNNYPDGAKDPEQRWIIVRESYIGLGYNTNLVKEADAPHAIKDLADPKWQGKLAVNSSASTLSNFLTTVVQKEGEDFARGLKKQNFRLVEGSARVVADLIVAGEVALSPTVFNSHVAASAAKGAPIAWLPLEPVWNTANAFALGSKSKHPATAMLLGDYMLSRAGQEDYKKVGYGSQRTDMQTPDMKFQRIKFDAKTWESQFERSAKLAQEIFYSGRS